MKLQMHIVTGILLAGLLVSRPAHALIKVDFTPVHLVKQSTIILDLSFEAPKEGKLIASVKRVVKGELKAAKILLDLTTATEKQQGEDLAKKIADRPDAPAILFIADLNGQFKAYLHVEGQWFLFFSPKPTAWQLNGTDNVMLGTWQGGTDMLIRAVNYILTDPAPDLPATEGVSWSSAEPKQFAKLTGPVHAAVPIELSDDGKTSLYLACETGDRLFEYNPATKTLKDTTEAHGLTSKSVAATWADFNADGRLDLASWDGQAITVFTQDAAGKFQPDSKLAKADIQGDVLGITALDAQTPGQAGIVISTRTTPILWIPTKTPAALAAAGYSAHLTKPGVCLIADFDGDGLPDILQPFANGSVILPGTAPSKFGIAKATPLVLGPGRASAFVGDFDGDGLLDIAVASEERCALWQNNGQFKFTESLAVSGEMGYKGNTSAVAGEACDFNLDGRQDIALFYSTGFPSLFFNRGFRSFGFSNTLDIEKTATIPDAKDGQQAGCFAFFNADGLPSLITILANGECWMMNLENGTDPPARIFPVLPKGVAGPVLLSVWRKDRSLGAWNLTGGHAPPAIPCGEGTTLKWQLPGGKPQVKQITPGTKKSQRVVLDQAKE